MSAPIAQFLGDTLVFSGLLIVLVLALRAPVARMFGPQVAYALWALPLLRLFMPPLTLPASMAPVAAAQPAAMILAADGGALAAPAVASAPVGIAWPDMAAAVWLAGAAVLLGWRMAQYRAMRRRFLAGARPVGEVGRIRLVESPAARQPLAFGIRDKVVVLPPMFMAHPDRTARDLAIAHELAHHRGHDLTANIAAQLVLAVHWFNPAAWIGWRAMRKDQEAACDARVIAGRARAERTRYAEVIAGFAAGDRLRLNAPLACPMLGEKSIIHRLRTLTLAEVSTARRRGGIALVAAAGVLALPLTASISYAQEERPAPSRLVIVDVPEGAALDDPALHTAVVEREDGTRVTLRTKQALSPAEARERVETAFATLPEPPLPLAPPAPPAAVAAPQPPASPVSQRRIRMTGRGEGGQNIQIITRCKGADVAACDTELRAIAHAEDAAARAEAEAAHAEAQAAHAEAAAAADTVRAEAMALGALRSARIAIIRARMPAEARDEALREIDREMAELREGYASSRLQQDQQARPEDTFEAGWARISVRAFVADVQPLRLSVKPAFVRGAV